MLWRSFLILAVMIATPPGVRAEPLVLDGRVEPSRAAVVSTRLDGVVAEVLFEEGEAVEAGQPLILLDPVDAELALAVAEAELARAEAEMTGATRNAARQEALFERGVAADAVVGPARTRKAAAEAGLQLARAERDRAALDLKRAVIRAPLSGVISAPAVVIGQFLEAEAGPPLATIAVLDPVVVAYPIPYADRLRSLADSGAATVEALLARVTLSLILPGDRRFGATATPDRASPIVDAANGTVTVRATFENPDRLLRPGMAVTVLSEIGPAGRDLSQ
ncbi:MAG: efflux RND transporter periplasmic adaptor subunit [Pseudomonadota bacterium]